MAYGGLPFPGTGYPILDDANIYLKWKSNVWASVFTIVHLPRMLQPTDFRFGKKNKKQKNNNNKTNKQRIGLVSIDLLHIILYHELMNNQQECF